MSRPLDQMTKCPHCMCGLNLPKGLLVLYSSVSIMWVYYCYLKRCEGICCVPGPEFPFLVFFLKGISFGPSRVTLWMKPGCSGRDGYRGCFRPPTHVDTARVILAGGLRNPGFLCICGTKGSHVAYGKPLHLRLPHLLQVGWCELSRWDLLRHSWTHPGCWCSHKHCMCLW